MKKVENIFDQICSTKNLFSAAHNTLLHGRRYRGEGAGFKFSLERNILKLQDELIRNKYRHGKYNKFFIHDPKKREVWAAPLKDRVVHHAVHDIIEPVIDRSFIFDSYACRRNKGTHKAIIRAQRFLNANQYSLHLDVKKYFPSINHEVLKNLLKKVIGDDRTLHLCSIIIDSVNERTAMRIADSLFDHENVYSVGLPIGNLTSQFFANLYLNELDQYVKHTLKVRYYLRYMDDILLFANDRRDLLQYGQAIGNFCLENLKLSLHEGMQAIPYQRGVAFLGFRIFRSHRTLKRDNVRRIRKRIKTGVEKIRDGISNEAGLEESLKAWCQWASFGDTFALRKTIGQMVYEQAGICAKNF